MTMAETKKWLGKVRHINKEIDTLQKEKRETREQITHITQSYQKDGAQSSKNPHKFDRLVILEDLIDQKTNELLAAKTELINAIMENSSDKYRFVILNYYVRCKKLEEIAVEYHFGYRTVKRYLHAGVKEISENIKLAPTGP